MIISQQPDDDMAVATLRDSVTLRATREYWFQRGMETLPHDQHLIQQPDQASPGLDNMAVATLRATREYYFQRGLEVLPHDPQAEDTFPELEATYDTQGYRNRITAQTVAHYQRILTTAPGTILAFDRAIYRHIKNLVDLDHFPGLMELLPGLDLWQQIQILATLACRKEGAAMETLYASLCAQPVPSRTALCRQVTGAYAITNGMTLLAGGPQYTDVIPAALRSQLFRSWKTTLVKYIEDIGERDTAARILHDATAGNAPPSMCSVYVRLIFGLPISAAPRAVTKPALDATEPTREPVEYVMMADARPLRSIGMAPEQRGDLAALPRNNRPLRTFDATTPATPVPPEPRTTTRYDQEPTDRELRAAYRQARANQASGAPNTGGRSRRAHAMAVTAAPSSDDEPAPDLVPSSDDDEYSPGPARTAHRANAATVQVQYLDDVVHPEPRQWTRLVRPDGAGW